MLVGVMALYLQHPVPIRMGPALLFTLACSLAVGGGVWLLDNVANCPSCGKRGGRRVDQEDTGYTIETNYRCKKCGHEFTESVRY